MTTKIGEKNDEEVVIVAAYRTPIGSFNGCLSSFKAHELGSIVFKHILEKTNTIPDDVIIGQALQAGQGQNPARQTAINAGCPNTVTATTINMLCGSGLKAVAIGYNSVKLGDANVVVCGGQESMSQAPHCIQMRNGCKMGDVQMIDSMLKDGLTDAFKNVPMGKTAENVAKEFLITRDQQDEFAYNSQNKYRVAKESKKFQNEIVPVKITVDKKGTEKIIDTDEFPKSNTTIDELSKLRPCFVSAGEIGGSVTAGNSSGINDGAALVMLMKRKLAENKGLKPLVKIVSWTQVGNDPMLMGVAPILSVRQVLEKAIWTADDVDAFELNEAFASQSVAIVKELKLDSSKVNINGGSIALGHPSNKIGCSGSRVLVTLINILLSDPAKKRGLAALCIGGGMSIAMCIEKC